MAQKYFKLFSEKDMEILSRKKFEFDSAIAIIQNHVSDLNGHLIISSWSHLDYIAQPYLATPDYELHTPGALEKRFDLNSIFIVTHPIRQWLFYLKYTTVSDLISIDEFLQGYWHFAEEASKGKYFKVEDIATEPDACLKKICKEMHIPFDPEYVENWPFYSNIESELIKTPLEDKAKEELYLEHLGEDEELYRAKMEANPDYHKILNLLNYEIILS